MLSFIRPLSLAATILLGACTVSATATKPPARYSWFPFTWYTAKLKGKKHKFAILVPVKVKDLQANFVA